MSPLDSIDGELDQLSLFHEDLIVLDKHTLGKYTSDFEELRDKTDKLRSEYAILYGKILEDNPNLKVFVGGV